MFATMTQEEVVQELLAMQSNPDMVTNHAYSPNKELWPDNRIPFVEVHMGYLKTHKTVDPKNYLSNLRLMIKSRA
jgi:hypothetical protein